MTTELIFMGYSHDDRPMFWAKTADGLKVCYGEPVKESIGLEVGQEADHLKPIKINQDASRR